MGNLNKFKLSKARFKFIVAYEGTSSCFISEIRKVFGSFCKDTNYFLEQTSLNYFYGYKKVITFARTRTNYAANNLATFNSRKIGAVNIRT